MIDIIKNKFDKSIKIGKKYLEILDSVSSGNIDKNMLGEKAEEISKLRDEEKKDYDGLNKVQVSYYLNIINDCQLSFDTLDNLLVSNDKALYFVESKIIPELKDKVSVRLYLDILACAFKDIMNIKWHLPLIIKSQEQLFTSLSNKLTNIEEDYKEIMLTRGKIELNVNLGLLLEHIFIFIK